MADKKKNNADEIAIAKRWNEFYPNLVIKACRELGFGDTMDWADFLASKDMQAENWTREEWIKAMSEDRAFQIEHKDSLDARGGNPTIKIFNKQAVGENSGFADLCADFINKTNALDAFIEEFDIINMNNDMGSALDRILDSYHKGGLTKAIDRFELKNMGELTCKFYAKKKCYYIQIGDSLYRTSTINPLNIDAPFLSSEGSFGLRSLFDVKSPKGSTSKYKKINGIKVNVYNEYMNLSPSQNKQSPEYKKHRAEWQLVKGGQFSVRFIPEAHFDNKTANKSNYSFEPNTTKIKPSI